MRNKRELLSRVTTLLKEFESNDLIENLISRINLPDEPHMFIYNITLKNSERFSDGKPHQIKAGGYSFLSKEFALFKCLMEAVERYSMINYRRGNLFKSSYRKLPSTGLNPQQYIQDVGIEDKLFYWCKGFDLINNKNVFLPAQLIYFNYTSNLNEPHLSEFVSTGGSAGLNQAFTLLQGIYEIIERDAFMTLYLTQSEPKHINLFNLQIPSLKKILTKSKRYR